MSDADLARRLLPLLDLTCLDEDADPATIATLCRRAQSPHGAVAAVCVYPEHVQAARAALPVGIAVATVVNFPDGGADPARVEREIRRARAVGAQEIDAVLPWPHLLAGGHDAPLQAWLEAARAASAGVTMKIIIESGMLAEPGLIERASALAIEAGADFIKTSTGKQPVGATLVAAETMLLTIRARASRCGFKAAGGLRTLAQVQAYVERAEALLGPESINPQRLRFGASGLLDQIEAALGHASPSTAGTCTGGSAAAPVDSGY